MIPSKNRKIFSLMYILVKMTCAQNTMVILCYKTLIYLSAFSLQYVNLDWHFQTNTISLLVIAKHTHISGRKYILTYYVYEAMKKNTQFIYLRQDKTFQCICKLRHFTVNFSGEYVSICCLFIAKVKATFLSPF